MNKIISFAPIASHNAKVLILGSIPSQISLAQNQYYAHPRNSFWFIIGSLFDIDQNLDYAKRVKLLQHKGVAVWDVLKTCIREGSLDSAIQEATMLTNDFQSFYANYPTIQTIFFNGAKAEAVYQKQVQSSLSEPFSKLDYFRLPSTSPALASLNSNEKLLKWQIIKDKLNKAEKPFHS